MRVNGAIEGAAAGFSVGDEVLVLKRHDNTSIKIIGFVGGIRKCEADPLNENDDGSTDLVEIGFDIVFGGQIRTHLYVNNNGNISFDNALYEYDSSFFEDDTAEPFIAAFLADVDTRGSGSGIVTYRSSWTSAYNSLPNEPPKKTFTVYWDNVGYYKLDNANTDKRNTFRLTLVDRADLQPGYFDVVFNYTSIQWEIGDASIGPGYAYYPLVGYNDHAGALYELAGSRIAGAFLNGGSHALISNNIGSELPGTYIFQFRQSV